MTKKVCLAPCLPGQEQETLSSVLGRWEEMGTFARSGFFFCQAFAEGSWIVTSNKEHHNAALDGGEWACLAVVLTLLCKSALGQGRFVWLQGLLSHFISVS